MDINAINRSDLMQQLSDKYGMDPRDAEQIVRIILETMSQSLISGKRIEIRGFGSFELRYRKPRQARNPKTGNVVQTSAKYSIHFKPGKEMRERVNESRNVEHADHAALTKRVQRQHAAPQPSASTPNVGWPHSSSNDDDDSSSSWH